MQKIEINTPEREKMLPILRDAIDRQKRILSESVARREQRIQGLVARLQVNTDLLLSGEVPHPENQEMELLELEGELEILQYLRD